MARDKRKPRSLRGKMLVFMLICWLLLVLLVLGSMSYYVLKSYNQRVKSEFAAGLEAGLRISSDRLDNAVSTLRRTSYDGTVSSDWQQWKNGEIGWIILYSRAVQYFGSLFRSDDRFPFMAFWYADDPENMRVSVYVEAAGGSFPQLNQFWQEDYEGISQFAEGLDTYVGVYENDGRLYLIRNLTYRFQVIGTQVVALSIDNFFDGLIQTARGQSLCVWLGGCRLVISGEEPDIEALGISAEQKTATQGTIKDGGRYCYNSVEGDGYTLSAVIQIDRSVLLEELRGYQTILIVLFLLLWPILIIYYRQYENYITNPIHKLMGGLRQIEKGNLGSQVDTDPKSSEFQYIIDSFNQMSSQLKAQFEQIYRKELSLRDARIKALQSQINPHFLNNTLEIINWEARIDGNTKVSLMIESLSTLLDAAMDRDSRQEIRFSEELNYINAYFYIADQRFGRRLAITKEIAPDTLDFMVPRLILQPIVENALEHGIAPGGQGRVQLRARVEDKNLIIEVENNGKLSEEDIGRIELLLSPDYDASKDGAYNLGIRNVSQRLRILCGGVSGLTLQNSDMGSVVARIVIAKSNLGEV